jgi:hypothetical protein
MNGTARSAEIAGAASPARLHTILRASTRPEVGALSAAAPSVEKWGFRRLPLGAALREVRMHSHAPHRDGDR